MKASPSNAEREGLVEPDNGVEGLRVALAATQAELAALRNSTSWRLTAPLRALMACLPHKRATGPSEKNTSEQASILAPEPSAEASAPAKASGQTRIAQVAGASMAQRLNTLAVEGHRVAYLAENLHSSTYRYRAYNMVQTLSKSQADRGALFFLEEVAHAQSIAQACTLLVISRARFDHRLESFVNAFHDQGKPVWFDLDDYLINTQAVGLLIHSQQQDPNVDAHWHYWYGIVSRMADAMRLCDGVMTTTPELAGLIKQVFQGPVAVLPNFANDEQQAVSAPLFEARQRAPVMSRLQDRVQLGYFSGSASHNGDFARLTPALCDWMERDPRVGLTVVGPLALGIVQERFAHRVTHLPFMDYLDLQQEMAKVDLNLIALQSNTFTHCKSELKYFEAALVGTPSIATDVPVYQRAIVHGQNGYLAYDNDWASAFRYVMAQAPDYDRVAQEAHRDALLHYTGQSHLGPLLALLNKATRT
jgi:glycosyltransferase involved in cell wall biosynthesis